MKSVVRKTEKACAMSSDTLVSGNFHLVSGPPFVLPDHVDLWTSDAMEVSSLAPNFELCLICQSQKEEQLVENPRSSYEALLNAISARSTYGETKYLEIWSTLKDLSSEELKLKKATWHRKCYQDVTHSGMLKRSKERYEKELAGVKEKKRKQESASSATQLLTRSQTSPYKKELCFFCDKPAGYRETLTTVRTISAGKSLHDAIELSGNDKLRVKLSTAVDVRDAHAIDIKYHKKRWGNYVSTVLRQSPVAGAPSISKSIAAEIAAKIEFVTTTEVALRNGNVLIMSDLQSEYECIRKENGVEDMACSRRLVKVPLKRNFRM